jgi:photosystem II stability/assembly factor-like uncharacterized protein
MTIGPMKLGAAVLLFGSMICAPLAIARDKGPGDDTLEAANAAEQFAQARTAPGIVAPGAYGAAFASLSALPVAGSSWSEVTKRPYNSDDPRYRDPDFSNSSGGAGFVAGRTTGLAVGGGLVYAGGANGGVFRSGDGGTTWAPMTDALPTLSVGTIELAGDGSLWLATGEANTGATAYVGSGVYRLSNPTSGAFSTTSRVGGDELESTTIGKLRFDGIGNVYAATSRGVWKHSASAALSTQPWIRVLLPVPGSTSPYDNICNDVAIDPRSGGMRIIANCAWRGGAAYNGFYLSNDGGVSFALVNPKGALNPQDVGRGTFAYSADGSQLYVVLESITMYLHHKNTVLGGIYNSPTGSVTGPWNKIGDSQKLAGSGSALKLEAGYRPGVQSWYNQMIAVDPADPKHLIVGLEEVFETRDAGVHWAAIAPYWNFGFDCWSIFDAQNTCPMAPHPDQHSIAIASGQLYIGNDGGVYTRPINGPVNAEGHATDWRSLNANLRTLQYYSVGVGLVPGGVAVSGGLQDNGTSLLLPEDSIGSGVMGSIAGGDGVKIIVDPNNGCKILTGYPDLNVWLTENCGRTDGTVSAFRDVSPTDPNPRFIAPYAVDGVKSDHWVIAGQYIWTNAKGFKIQTAAEWKLAYDNGVGRATTALASRNDVVWSAWCGPCNNDGFARGISTNAGGTYRQVSLPDSVPNRYIDSIAIDAADASGRTAYVAFNGFSRRWTEGPGAGIGHLYKTTDAGATWTDVSGTLPDVPLTTIIVRGSNIVAGSDLAVLVSSNGGATWSRLGGNFPVTTVMDLTIGPDGLLYAATHGRGIWSIPAP